MGGEKRKRSAESDQSENEGDFEGSKKHPRKAGAIEMDETCVVPKWEKGSMKGKLTDTTTFMDKYPNYRSKYIQESMPIMKELLMKGYCIKITNYEDKQELRVQTTDSTWDPYSIMKAKQFIELICRSMPVERAQSVFDDEKTSVLLKIKGLCGEKVFTKRRSRVMGPEDSTLDMLERMLEVWVSVQGGTVAIVGSYSGVEQARRFVNAVMKGSLPVDLLKAIETKLALQKDDSLKDKDWSTVLPSVKKTNQDKKKKQKKLKIRKEKEYNPLPPAPLQSKLDAQLEDGKFFLADHVFKKDKKSDQNATAEKRRADKMAAKHTAPVEASKSVEKDDGVDAAKLKEKLKARKAKL